MTAPSISGEAIVNVEAQNRAMPLNAVSGDHVDAMLSVEAIGDALVQLARGLMVLVRDTDIPRRRARAPRG